MADSNKIKPLRIVDHATPQEFIEPFYNVPTSPATNLFLEVLENGQNLTALKNKKVSHSQTIEVLGNGNARQVIATTDKATITLELSDIDKLIGTNKPAKKMFIYTLIKLNEQAFSNGDLKRNYIQFPLQELIDIGFYSRPQSARKGFNDAMDILTSFKIKGTLQKGRKKTIEQSAIAVLFPYAEIKKGTCTITVNDKINWNFITQFYTIVPRNSFKLGNRAFDLQYYIFYLARQNVKKIEDKGYFTISLRAIQQKLSLPMETDTVNPYRDIMEKGILKAVEEIKDSIDSTEYKLSLVYDANQPIASYLSNGYLKVELKGSYATRFIEISKNQAKQIETAQKRKQTIQDKAIAMKMSQKIEA